MNTKRPKPKLTKKQRHLLRVRQVRRQKFFLFCIFLLIILSLIVWFVHFPGTRENTYQINASCESYREEVTDIAAQYDMSDYVDLILAVMMQESSGQGTDPMQSSEGAYNTQYPQEPNGITNSSYSITCGIQELIMPLKKPVVQALPISLTSVLHSRHIISVQTPTFPTWRKMGKRSGLQKVPRLLHRWQAEEENVMRMIPSMIPQVHGITVISTIRIMYCGIIPLLMNHRIFYEKTLPSAS